MMLCADAITPLRADDTTPMLPLRHCLFSDYADIAVYFHTCAPRYAVAAIAFFMLRRRRSDASRRDLRHAAADS